MLNKQSKKKIKDYMDQDYKPFERKTSSQTFKKKVEALKAKHLNSNKMRWSQQQNLKYVEFIAKHAKTFSLPARSQKHGIFYKMALFIRRRNSVQCRTHHQKMLLKFKNVSNMIHFYGFKSKQESTLQSDLDYEKSSDKQKQKILQKRAQVKHEQNYDDKNDQTIVKIQEAQNFGYEMTAIKQFLLHQSYLINNAQQLVRNQFFLRQRDASIRPKH